MDSTPLGDCFRTFKGSYIHMLVAVHLKHTGTGSSVDFHGLDSNALLQAERAVSGVITLEDVLEEVIQAEIVDESDNYMNNDQKTRIGTNKGNTDMAAFLGMIHNNYRDMRPQLSDSVRSEARPEAKTFVPLYLDRRMIPSFKFPLLHVFRCCLCLNWFPGMDHLRKCRDRWYVSRSSPRSSLS